MKHLIILLFFALSLTSLPSIILAKNLDSLSQIERNKILIKMAKEVVLRHGPGFYREYKEPVIKSLRVSDETRDLKTSTKEKHKGRSYYTVEYPYDLKEEMFIATHFAARVYVWGDTGKVFIIEFGCGFGIYDYDTLSEKEKKKLPLVEYDKILPLKLVTDTIRDAKGNIIKIKHRYEK